MRCRSPIAVKWVPRLLAVFLLLECAWPSVATFGQGPSRPPKQAAAPRPVPPSAPQSDIANSEEWQATRRALEQWLSVQQIYTDEEIKEHLAKHIIKLLSNPEDASGDAG